MTRARFAFAAVLSLRARGAASLPASTRDSPIGIPFAAPLRRSGLPARCGDRTTAAPILSSGTVESVAATIFNTEHLAGAIKPSGGVGARR
jgi:hypothetical protein